MEEFWAMNIRIYYTDSFITRIIIFYAIFISFFLREDGHAFDRNI